MSWGRLDGGFRAAGPCGEVNVRPQRTAAVHISSFVSSEVGRGDFALVRLGTQGTGLIPAAR